MSTGYFAPFVAASGLSVPTYEEILDDNIAQFLKIFGANQYVSEDSAIYQFLSVISLKNSDCLQALVYAYNQSSPLTAIGAGLDRIVKLNGIARAAYTFSTAELTVTGTVGTTINNGEAQDQSGNLWILPTPTVIPSAGFIIVEATCQTAGNITAEPGQINIIATPQSGWTSVTNAAAATPGNPVETDSQLRARQAISVALPSQTMLDGVIAAIAAVPGVTRYNVVENDTNAVDVNGNPPHSITAVVEGGTELAVAMAIYDQKGIGCYTNGTTTVPVTDPNSGLVTDINYDLPTYVAIFVIVNVHGLTGFTSAMPAAIQTAITNYLNSLQIGEEVTLSALYAIAMSVTANLAQPSFSIRGLFLGTTNPPTGTNDIPLTFNQVAQGIAANIQVNQV
jgi:uncharacterized phage protein gp47/JayE